MILKVRLSLPLAGIESDRASPLGRADRAGCVLQGKRRKETVGIVIADDTCEVPKVRLNRGESPHRFVS